MILYKKGKKMAKDIQEIIKEIRNEEASNIEILDEAQQYMYYNHKRIETENAMKSLGLKFKKGE